MYKMPICITFFQIYDNGYLSIKHSTMPEPKPKDVTGIFPYYGMFSVKVGGLYYRQANDQVSDIPTITQRCF